MPRKRVPLEDQRGIGLFEVMAGTIVATLAVLGLAYSFGIGRGLIDRYAIARAAMGRAQLLVDSLSTVPPSTLVVGSYNQPFWVDGQQAGAATWEITTVDDPIDDVPSDPDPVDMKKIVVTVAWGSGSSRDQLAMSRMVLAK